MKAKISDLRIDGGTQSRAAIDQNLINEYTEDMRNGAQFPPVIVFNDGRNMWLADGFHRYYATIVAGLTEIQAQENEGTLQDAKRYSMSANAKHGARRTNADKRHAVLMALEDEEYKELSNLKIAEICGVGEHLVRTVKNEVNSPKANFDQPSPTPQSTSEIDRLKKELGARDEFEKQQERDLEAIVQEKVQERLAQLEIMYQEKQSRAIAERVKLEHAAAEKRLAEMKAKLEVAESAQKIDQNVIEKLVAERTAEKMAELENARRETEAAKAETNKRANELHRQYQEKEAALERQLEEKMREIDEATKAEKDITALTEERRKLTEQIKKLKADREYEAKCNTVSFRVRRADEAIANVLSSSALIRSDFGTPENPDPCGLTVEKIEDVQKKHDVTIQELSKTSAYLLAILDSIKKGGGLRVAR
jgi:chromosome segregation ATPase